MGVAECTVPQSSWQQAWSVAEVYHEFAYQFGCCLASLTQLSTEVPFTRSMALTYGNCPTSIGSGISRMRFQSLSKIS
eukprot:4434500-Pyramimonas_sp.AAC.1